MWSTSKRSLVTMLLSLAAFAAVGGADSAQADGDADRVVLRVGSQTMTVRDVERRLDRLPEFQRVTYGSTPDEVKRNFVQQVLVPELLFAQGALDRGLANDEQVQMRERDLLKSVLLESMRDDAVSPDKVSPEEVLAYYEQNKDRYNSPARVAIWRILAATPEQAQQILDRVKKDPTPRTWTEIARDQSLDKSTHLQGGNLGFLTADGTSADGKTRVDKAIVEAAMRIADGELVDHPVPEGSGFAVVWRRGSMPAVSRSLKDEEQTIRRLIARERSTRAQEKLIAELRSRDARMVNPNAVDLIDVRSTGEVGPRAKPGRIDRRLGRGAPRETDRGLR